MSRRRFRETEIVCVFGREPLHHGLRGQAWAWVADNSDAGALVRLVSEGGHLEGALA